MPDDVGGIIHKKKKVTKKKNTKDNRQLFSVSRLSSAEKQIDATLRTIDQMGLYSPTYKGWYANKCRSIGPVKFLAYALYAERKGRDKQRYFNWLLTHTPHL